MKKYLLSSGIIVWWLLLGVSFAWNISVLEQHDRQLALDTARAYFQQIVYTREWNAAHGGVYVRVNEETQPNPYLKASDRVLTTRDDIRLTLINPAQMTREISEISDKGNKKRFHITSLKPLRPENRAEPWEEVWLKSFETGVVEQSAFVKTPQGRGFRYMAPLQVQESCLDCHRHQDYKLGDVRGGISISLPFRITGSRLSLLFWHFLLALAGTGAFLFLGQRLLAAYQVIRHQAAHDALTGVPNRRSFTERLLDESRRSSRNHQPLSIIMCDIDDFKRYNDYYGHVEGDRCLMKVASVLIEAITRNHDFCARYGGEEFVIILPDTDCDGASHVADRILEKIRSLQMPHQASRVMPFVTLSLGVSTDRYGMQSQDILLVQADNALYQAKEAGKNQARCICAQQKAEEDKAEPSSSGPE